MTSLVRVGVSGEVHAAARRVERPGEDVGLGEGVDAAADVRGLALRHAVDGLLTVEAHGLVCNKGSQGGILRYFSRLTKAASPRLSLSSKLRHSYAGTGGHCRPLLHKIQISHRTLATW